MMVIFCVHYQVLWINRLLMMISAPPADNAHTGRSETSLFMLIPMSVITKETFQCSFHPQSDKIQMET